MKKKKFSFDTPNSESNSTNFRGKKCAVSLGYDAKHQPVPVLLAAGVEQEAKEIEKIARRHGVPIHRNPDLARDLLELELDQEIKQKQFKAVASVFAKIEKS